MSPSCPYQFVAVLATTMLCASTIFPITPPELFAAAINTGLNPVRCAVIFCKLPNKTFEAVSDPVSATPSQPNNVPKNGYKDPVCANANPSVASAPENFVTYPRDNIDAIVISENRTR